MIINRKCGQGHEYVQTGIYHDWPKGAPYCPKCFKEWEAGITIEDSWAFFCLVHGLETQAFCWRAFQEKNIHRWALYSVEKVETSEEQRRAHFDELSDSLKETPGEGDDDD